MRHVGQEFALGPGCGFGFEAGRLGRVSRQFEFFRSFPDFFTQLRFPGLQLPGAQAHRPIGRADAAQQGESREPPGLIKMRFVSEAEAGSGQAPDAVAVAGLHGKGVLAGGQRRVISDAPRPGVLPFLIISFQAILKAHQFRRRKIQSRVMNLDVAAARRQCEGVVQFLRSLIDKELFDFDFRRIGVLPQTHRIDHDHAVHSRKPKLVIGEAG